MKKRILSTYCAPEACFAKYRDEFDIDVCDHKMKKAELAEVIAQYDGVYVNAIAVPDFVIEAGAKGKLKVISNNGVGYDAIDVAKATELGIAILNTPTTVTESTAEHAAALCIAAMRGIVRYDRMVRNHGWVTDLFPDTDENLFGGTVGILGFGRIGKRVAARLKGFDMNVIYYDVFRAPEEVEKELGVTYMPFEEVLKEADCITLHMPYMESTHHLMNADAFAKMKKTAYFVNAARGKVVDEHALAEALKNHVIKGAACDVFEDEPYPLEELLTLDNITLTPHVATATLKTRMMMAEEALSGLAAYLRGEVPSNLVNKEVLNRQE